MIDLRLGDCLDVMRSLETASVEAVVCDPPAGIGFMGKKWDTPGSLVEREADTRNKWDQVGGNHHPSDGIDLGRTRRSEKTRFVDFLAPRFAEVRRVSTPGSYMLCWALPRTSHWTGTAIEDAGWVIRDRVSHLFGSGFPKSKACLKPAVEDWWLAWNPAKKVTPLNIDACRIPGQPEATRFDPSKHSHDGWRMNATGADTAENASNVNGRWPANLTHDGSPEVMEAFGAFGDHPTKNGAAVVKRRIIGGFARTLEGRTDCPEVVPDCNNIYRDSGSAARFFYCAKASRADRDDGNNHPTVKSTELMRWLCRLITPPGGVVLDPFMGSGSTGKACVAEGFGFVGIEQDAEYLEIARRRINAVRDSTPLFGGA